MSRIKFCAFLIFFVSLFFATHTRPVFADSNFGITLTSEYDVSDNGSTLIQQHFQLTNKKATVFAKEYELEVGATQLQNVRVTDDKNVVIPSTIATTNNTTNITVTFPDDLVGEGKTRTFTITFENPDTAKVHGKTLEVYVPKLKNADTFDTYQVIIKTPKSFGEPARVTPQTYTESQNDTQLVLTFAQLGNEGISALFGDRQIFAYTLHYNLQNTTGSTGVIQIALPPDTAYQKVVYTSLTPQPKDMTRDSDGNWIATYEIEAEKNIDVALNGKVTLYLTEQNTYPQFFPGDQLLQSQKYWEIQDARIQSLAQQYPTPKKIYDYVVSHLTYNYAKVTSDTVTRLGALGALDDPKNAACQEFTDLFIAIARAAHIPARRATGFAYTENDQLRPLGLVKDVLHAWPEYFDASKKTWIPVDPTWGNTTGGINYFDQFDFNHFVFAMNGTSSTLPYGAGSYTSPDQTKNVDVHFASDMTVPQPHFTITITKTPFWRSLFRNQYVATIHNDTGAALYQLPINATLNQTQLVLHNAPTSLDYLLPFQSRQITFDVSGASIIQHLPFTLTLTIQGISSTHDLETGFADQELIVAPLFGVAVGACVVLIAFITWRLLVSRR